MTGQPHIFHRSRFRIAELEGESAAALSTYDPSEHGAAPRGSAMFSLFPDFGLDPTDTKGWRRGGVFRSGIVAEHHGPAGPRLVIENAATLPAFRRRGLTGAFCATCSAVPDGALVEAERAEIAGVSRRTVFNHFESREALLTVGIDAAIEAYLERMPVRGERDLDEWLRDVVAASAAQNAERGGWYFQTLLAEQAEATAIGAPAPTGRPDPAEHPHRRRVRGRGMSPPLPDDVVVGFNVWLGAFAVAALRVDCGIADMDAVDLVLRELHAVLAEAVT
ncbi:MAG TPA: TetR/AcrR family transcriptional regulator [Acidimicrobiales bacterium]|nr:TetR/AcrR family transcriptional regulator [Acidimicrobiales bacterium]